MPSIHTNPKVTNIVRRDSSNSYKCVKNDFRHTTKETSLCSNYLVNDTTLFSEKELIKDPPNLPDKMTYTANMSFPRSYTDTCLPQNFRDVSLGVSENIITISHDPSMSDNNKSFKLNPEASPFVPCSSSILPIGIVNNMTQVTSSLTLDPPLNSNLMNNPVLLAKLKNVEPLSVSTLNVSDSPFIMSNIDSRTKSILNPCADIFIPLTNRISDEDLSPKKVLKKLKLENAHKIVIGHLNINSIRNKFDNLKYIIDNNVDILLISETKLNETFPENQFIIHGFHPPYRRDRDDKGDKGGGLLLYLRDYIPSRKINVKFDPIIEAIVIEINLKKKKWLIISSYNPHKSMIHNHLKSISMQLDEFYKRYENIIIIGDFNSEICEDSMNEFCCLYNLKSLVNKPTCFKNPDHPSCIDLILTNKWRSFQNTSIIETGLSDFHKLTLTVMKMNYQKQVPKVIYYRNYKFFDNQSFRADLLKKVSMHGIYHDVDCKTFEDIFLDTLDMHAPLKKRYIRANNAPFMTKDLCKSIMVRSRLRNKFLKLKTIESRKAYQEQRNYCVSLFRTAKRHYYENLDVKLVTDNKKIWKHVKPFFTEKISANSNITLIETNDIISNPEDIAEIMNNFFSDAAINLGVDRELHTLVSDASDPVTKAIEKYKYHPSIVRLNEEHFPVANFDFYEISELNILKVIEDLDSSKSYQKGNIPPKILKDNKDICAMVLTTDISRCVKNGSFPDNLKNADITPIFKKEDRLLKANYRPVSILPTFSKIYEKIFYLQIYEYFNSIFSKYLCGFRKGHSTQHCLLFMLENLKKSLDNGFKTGILLTDLSKAFDSVSHDLLLAKLNAYGFCNKSLKLINDYLTDRKQRTKIGSSFSSWRELVYGVPQGSILGPLLFNIYINDLFLFTNEFKIANYADDCSPFEFSGSTDDVINKLENDSRVLIDWYESNYLKPNPNKWHLLLSEVDKDLSIEVSSEHLTNSSCEKILGVDFDNKLNFDTHITKLCKKAGQKLHALARVSNFMSVNQKRVIMNAFIYSQFSYCPLIWMCHSRTLNTKINKLHERALRLVYNDNISSFETLLEKSGSVKIHHRNLQQLAIEIYKALNDLSSSLMAELFKFRHTCYNLRAGNKLESNNIKTVNYGTESISYLAPKIWEQVPNEIKESSSLYIFKRKIKMWIPDKCPCRICKIYVQNLGYLN